MVKNSCYVFVFLIICVLVKYLTRRESAVSRETKLGETKIGYFAGLHVGQQNVVGS